MSFLKMYRYEHLQVFTCMCMVTYFVWMKVYDSSTYNYGSLIPKALSLCGGKYVCVIFDIWTCKKLHGAVSETGPRHDMHIYTV